MTFETRRRGIIINIIYIQTTLCSLLSLFMASHGSATDILCLKSIKDSLEDPYGYLSSSWDFSNKTEGFICRFNGVECWKPDENRVLNLKLSNMGLKGQFPRAIQNCSSLTGLDLSLNELSGPIPSDISTLIRFATSVDLSNNKLSGEIPASFGNCSYLNFLNLDNNMLSGRIPQELGLLTRIRSISFANNYLSGPVPALRDGSATADSFANNRGLCGAPLPPCPMGFHQSFKAGLIAGFSFSFIISVSVACMSYCPPWRRVKQTKNNRRNKAGEVSICACGIIGRKTRAVASQIHKLIPLRFQEKGSRRISKLLERLTSTMMFDELNDATDCFSMDNAIGVGRMGIMYKGVLADGLHLAVKRLFDSQQFGRQFFLEIKILGKIQHRNIVPLLGFCVEREERLLAYKYMSNGRLSKWLHPMESEVIRLTWPQRVKIGLGVARALSWLHHTCNLHIVHLNISSVCVLLDDHFEPKLSNFGEAKFMNHNHELDDLGMRFYVKDGKKDVHDFGSLLLELATGKTYNELLCSSATANPYGNPSSFYDAIDKSLIGKGFENQVFSLIKVACECVQFLPYQRPTMLQVYNNMSNIWEGQHGLSDDSDMSRQSEIVCVTDSDEIVEL